MTPPDTNGPTPAMQPEPMQTLIRMYGQGFGDCFLLAFPRVLGAGEEDGAEDAGPVYVLIDCGVIAGTPDGPARMRSVVADVIATTGGRLDLLIITHEHWDHLSGFVQAAALWEELEVDALWVAWTELPDQEGLPEVLRKILAKQHLALSAAAELAVRQGVSERYPDLLGLTSFLGEPAAGQLFAAAGVGDAFEAAKGLVAEERRVYCEPGEVHPVPGTGVSAYVLGPPRADEWLRKVHPSSVTPETYGHLPLAQLAEGRSEFNAFVMPLLSDYLRFAMDGPNLAAGSGLDVALERDLLDRSFPFDRTVRIPLPLAEAEAATAPEHYPALASYYDPVNHWRRIDADWLAAAEAFALQADALTNNTSLALAFELPAQDDGRPRKVLLFPGDAQVGALLSWDEIPAWQPLDGATLAQAAPDMADLLGRTVFYKVGHHGSHNATLKAGGVERMPADGALTAFVPVSLPVARRVKGWERIPLDELLNALDTRADERVVLPDGSVWPLTAAESAAALERLGVTLSSERLPAKMRTRDGLTEQLEPETPLWVQIAVDW